MSTFPKGEMEQAKCSSLPLPLCAVSDGLLPAGSSSHSLPEDEDKSLIHFSDNVLKDLIHKIRVLVAGATQPWIFCATALPHLHR